MSATALTAMLAGLAAAQSDHPERQPVSCPRGPRLQLRQCGGRWRDVDPRCAGCPLGRERSWQLAEATGEITPKGPPSGTTTIAELLGTAGEHEQEDAMQEQDPTKTTSDESTPETRGLALCPCGCGREVAPGRTYASKGCAGRMRWRGVGHPKERVAGNQAEEQQEEAKAPEQRCAHLEERNEELRLQLATVREETARRCEQEAAALTARLEAAEAENRRLLGSLYEEQRQRGTIAEALGLAPATRSVAEILAAIRGLRDGQGQAQDEPEGEPLDLACLPRPADLPAGYAFEVAEYISDLAMQLIHGAAAPKET